MKFTSRLKFATGIIIVITLCLGLFVYLDYSMSKVASVDAQLNSDTYTVGIDYSGIIERQYVEESSYVEVGDPLFELRSSTLSNAIADDEVAQSLLLYSVGENGLVKVSAAAPGQVQSIGYREGAFVPANSQIAVINLQNKLFVEATYKLSSPDYARLDRNSRVSIVFPDNKVVEGTVYDITLANTDGEVLTTVRARFNEDAINKTTFAVGTPLQTTLHFDSETWLNRIINAVQSLFKPSSGA